VEVHENKEDVAFCIQIFSEKCVQTKEKKRDRLANDEEFCTGEDGMEGRALPGRLYERKKRRVAGERLRMSVKTKGEEGERLKRSDSNGEYTPPGYHGLVTKSIR
jgi:hypothetical protein